MKKRRESSVPTSPGASTRGDRHAVAPRFLHIDLRRIPQVVGDLGNGARAHAIELGRRNAGPDWRRHFMERADPTR